jgi:hypothetical protein
MTMSRLKTEPRIVCGDTDRVRVPDESHTSVHVWRDRHGAIRAHSHTVGDRYWMHLSGIASYSFDIQGQDVVAYPERDVSDRLVCDVYRRTVVPLILQLQGYEVLHASAILLRQSLVAFCGISETGKSTLAYGLSRTLECRLWADDSLVFRACESGYGAIALPFSMRLREASARFFGEDRPIVHGSLDWETFDGVIGPPAPVSAVCALVRDAEIEADQVVAVRRLPRDRALVYALTNANCFSFEDSARKKETLEHYLGFTSQVPFYEIRFRPGFEHVGRVIDDVAKFLKQKLLSDGDAGHQAAGDATDSRNSALRPAGRGSLIADHPFGQELHPVPSLTIAEK